MRHRLIRAWVALALLMAAAPAFATAPVTTVMGPSREVSLRHLQKRIDHLVGPGHVDAATDFIGAHPGDPDPWVWINNGVHAIAVTLIDRESLHGAVGWYEETGRMPVLDGVGDGVVLEGLRVRGARTLVAMPASVKRFGFYVARKGQGEGKNTGQTAIFFTNHVLNGLVSQGRDTDPSGTNFRLLVFDVSRWLGADTWLVASHFSDRGNHGGLGDRDDDGDGDDDDLDILFTVTGLGVTPTHSVSFARVKALYR